MNEIDKASEEIISSLNKYIEKQKKIIEEETKEILEKGRKDFEEYIVERKEPTKQIQDNTIPIFSEIQKAMKVLSVTVIRNTHKMHNFILHFLQINRRG